MKVPMDPRNRDPLAIGIGLVGVAFQLGLWIWWGGRMSERLENVDKRVAVQEAANTAQQQTDALQTRDIAVIGAKLDDVKAGVDAANRKLDRAP